MNTFERTIRSKNDAIITRMDIVRKKNFTLEELEKIWQAVRQRCSEINDVEKCMFIRCFTCCSLYIEDNAFDNLIWESGKRIEIPHQKDGARND
jgi:hypothetical protein